MRFFSSESFWAIARVWYALCALVIFSMLENAWQENVHRQLDDAVFAAYGWSPTMSDDELLASFLELNHNRAAEVPQH